MELLKYPSDVESSCLSFLSEFNGDFERAFFAFQVMHFLTDLPRENMTEFKWFFLQLISQLFNLYKLGYTLYISIALRTGSLVSGL